MHQSRTIYFTVTNDLVTDQRMIRICGSMAAAGYQVVLVGRLLPGSMPLGKQPFEQVRLVCRFTRGKLFYLEYNWRLYRYLLRQKMDALCAIDLDTIIPVYWVSRRRKLPRMYDAHEYFTEMIEVKRRPHIYKVWRWIEKRYVPQFEHGYTVAKSIADTLLQLYRVQYEVVRNVPYYLPPPPPTKPIPQEILQLMNRKKVPLVPACPILLYQGAVNEGRALLPLIEAMQEVEAILLLAGNGNLYKQVETLITKTRQQHKIFLLGSLPPSTLRHLTQICNLGITLFEPFGLNQYYSLANKFFDYIMARKPQLCVNFPEYARILQQFPVAWPLEQTTAPVIAAAINKLLEDNVLLTKLAAACEQAAQHLNWENEEKLLLACWQRLWEKATYE